MPYRFAFVMEQTLGQVTHTQNFQQWVAKDQDVAATWIPVSFDEPDYWRETPVVRTNWTLRASLRARSRVQALLRNGGLDGLFFHTQVTALFAHGIMGRVPTVVSMDATPINFDSIGLPYNHRPSAYAPVEALKNALTRRTFKRAAKLVVWHDWGKRSLVADYGIPTENVEVIPPGIDLQRWCVVQRPGHSGDRVRLLFVGGDFCRKGGETLLAAFRERLAAECELDIVTREPVHIDGLPGVRVHHNIGPNAPSLIALYERADIFVFPTQADVLPLAISEALACGLPVISTAVGAIREQIEEGVTGLLVPLRDPAALSEATLSLVRDPARRLRMGMAARQVAETRFNGARNYRALLDVCKNAVDMSKRRTPGVSRFKPA
jgi:glycosyltransferase involved in cell wall biosynthesis